MALQILLWVETITVIKCLRIGLVCNKIWSSTFSEVIFKKYFNIIYPCINNLPRLDIRSKLTLVRRTIVATMVELNVLNRLDVNTQAFILHCYSFGGGASCDIQQLDQSKQPFLLVRCMCVSRGLLLLCGEECFWWFNLFNFFFCLVTNIMVMFLFFLKVRAACRFVLVELLVKPLLWEFCLPAFFFTHFLFIYFFAAFKSTSPRPF